MSRYMVYIHSVPYIRLGVNNTTPTTKGEWIIEYACNTSNRIGLLSNGITKRCFNMNMKTR